MKLSYVEITPERIAMLKFVVECLIDMGDERVVHVLNTICDPVDEDLIASCVPKLREMIAEAALAQQAQPCKHTYSEASAYCLGCNELRQAQPETPLKNLSMPCGHDIGDKACGHWCAGVRAVSFDKIVGLPRYEYTHDVIDHELEMSLHPQGRFLYRAAVIQLFDKRT